MVRLNSNRKILRFPRLDTVLMVEEEIRKNSGNYKKIALWEMLPKKMMYQTFCVILDYLIYSKKIIIDSSGKIIWIGQNEENFYFNNKGRKDE